MSRYMVLFELDTSRTPEDPKAKKAQWLGQCAATARQLKEGVTKDWGLFAGETCGYAIFEGSAAELQTFVSSWVPFVKCRTRQLMTFEEWHEAMKALPE